MSLRYLPVLGNSVAKASRTLFPCFESLHLQPGYHGSRSILCRNFHPLRRKFGSERQNTAFQSFGSRPWPWWHPIRSFWFQVQVWPVFYAEEVIPAALFWTFVIFISFIRSRVREEIRKYCPTFWYELCIFGNFQWKRIYLNRDSTELQSIMYEATQVNNDRRKWASRRRYKLATWHSLLVEQGRASSQPDVYSYTCMEIWSMRQVWRARKMFKSCGSNLLIQ